jgi:RNA binding exosome subunit
MVLDTIFTHLSSSDIDRIDEEMVTRIDRHGFLFLRLDKQKLLNGIYEITESGDCFHFKIKLVAFPANDEMYLETATKILSSYRK